MTARQILDWLQGLDRRIIYAFVLTAVTLPFFAEWPPIRVDVSQEVEDLYATIIDLDPNGSKVCVPDV